MLKHGTSSSYTYGGCRCRPCTTAHAGFNRRRRRLMATGRWEGLVDPGPARDHLNSLLANGMTRQQVSARSGLTMYSLRSILTGRVGSIQSATEKAILGTHVQQKVPGVRLDATGSRRRLRSLQLAGWTFPELHKRSGIARSTIQEVGSGRQLTVRASTHDAIVEMTRFLDKEKVPTTRYGAAAIRAAAAAGWVDLAAWDDIDDPNEKPKGIPSQEAPQGPPRVEADVIATIHRLHRAGLTDRAIAYQLGYATTSAIQKLRHRHREEDAA